MKIRYTNPQEFSLHSSPAVWSRLMVSTCAKVMRWNKNYGYAEAKQTLLSVAENHPLRKLRAVKRLGRWHRLHALPEKKTIT